MAIIEGTRASKMWQGEYDFAVDGGAISTITLRSNDGPIPAGSLIMQASLEIVTQFTTGSAAQAALSVEGAGDVVAATVVSGAPYSSTGLKSTIQVGTGATMLKTTAARNPTIAISVGTVTAGKLRLTLEYR